MSSTTKKKNSKILSLHSKNLTSTLYDLKWVPSSCRFVTLGSFPRKTGALHVFSVNDNEIEQTGSKEYRVPFKCGTFGATPTNGGRLFVTGDFEGRASVWNLDDLGIPLWTSKAHETIIHCIDGIGGNSEGAQEIVTGGKDGVVKLFDIRTKNSIGRIAPLSNSDKPPQVWTVSFGNSYSSSQRDLAIGYETGDIKLYDLRMNKVKWETKLGQGICSIQFDSPTKPLNTMAVTCLSGFIYLFDMQTQHSVFGFESTERNDSSTTIWLSRFYPQNSEIFLTGSGQGSAHLYRYQYPKERRIKREEEWMGAKSSIQLLAAHSFSKQPILCFDWNADFPGLVCVGSIDSTVNVALVDSDLLK